MRLRPCTSGPQAFPSLARFAGIALLAGFALVYLIWIPIRPSGAPLVDFSAYYAAGVQWLHGADPYGADLWSIERTLPGADPMLHDVMPFVGPPASLPLWAGFGLLPYSVAAVLAGVIAFISALGIVAMPVLLVKRRIDARILVSLVLLVIAAGPLVTGISVGQAALPTVFVLDLAIACAATQRWGWASVCAFVAATLKPNVALVLLGALNGFAAFAAFGAAALAWIAANLPFAGVHGIENYLSLVELQTAAERFYVYQFAPAAILHGFGVPKAAAVECSAGIAALAVAAAVLAIRVTRASVVDACAIACAALVFTLPYVHEPDMAIAFLPALLVVLRARGGTWVLGAIGMTLLCVPAFAFTQGNFGYGYAAVVATVVTLQLAVLAPAAAGWLRAVPLCVLGLIGIIAVVAPEQHLPMIPHAGAAVAQQYANAAPSAQWHATIVGSGLEEPSPWAAFARLLTLAGSLLAGIAMTRIATRRMPASALQALPAGSGGD